MLNRLSRQFDQRLQRQLVEVELWLNLVLCATAGATQNNCETQRNETTIAESAFRAQKKPLILQ